MMELALRPGVDRIIVDMCAFGLKSTDEEGEGLVEKTTALLTNCPGLVETMSRRCEGGHRHVHLISGRAKAAQEYTQEFCESVTKGLALQIRWDSQDVGALMNLEDEHDDWAYVDLGKVQHSAKGREPPGSST